MSDAAPIGDPLAGEGAYRLDEQVGFLLRQASQRHAALFVAAIGPDLTPTQWAALAKLAETGPLSQNLLGRQTAMDSATIKGVIDRLARRGLVDTRPDPEDARRVIVALTEEGTEAVRRLVPRAQDVTADTLAPLSEGERRSLLELLAKLR